MMYMIYIHERKREREREREREKEREVVVEESVIGFNMYISAEETNLRNNRKKVIGINIFEAITKYIITLLENIFIITSLINLNIYLKYCCI